MKRNGSNVRGLLQPWRDRQALGLEELPVEQPRLVAGGGIAQHGDDGLAGTELLGQPDRAGDIHSRRGAQCQPLVLDQRIYGAHRFLVGDPESLVDRKAFEVGGDPALADALGDRAAFRLELAGLVITVQRRARHIGEGDDDIGIALAQGDRDPGEGAAGTDGADEGVDLAAGLLPDLGAGRFCMRVAVGDIVELVGKDSAMLAFVGKPRRHPSGNLHVIVWVFVRHGRHFDDGGAECAERVLFLFGLGLGNDDHGAHAERVADNGQADAGVAGGAVDDDSAGAKLASLDRVADDAERRPVLYRLAGVHEFGLAEDRAAGFLRSSPELDQRRVADRIEDGVADLHWPAM